MENVARKGKSMETIHFYVVKMFYAGKKHSTLKLVYYLNLTFLVAYYKIYYNFKTNLNLGSVNIIENGLFLCVQTYISIHNRFFETMSCFLLNHKKCMLPTL